MPNLVGIGLSQVPTNSMLGGLAYQDPEHASIKDLDLKNLSQINSEIADTARDIFVYDTRKDSDGGAWRKRTQNTSWYNETLNTSTRGSRKEFPAVAVIVLDDLTSTGKMTIYDGDDPDLPMWMVFTGGVSAQEMLPSFNATKCSCLSALNGQICVGNNTYDLQIIDFIKDGGTRISDAGQYPSNHNISTRNSALKSSPVSTGSGLVNRAVNDVAMTVLPNAPIDDATGLPVPTIAVATGGGTSVIRDDGTVFDLTYQEATNNQVPFLDIDSNGRIYWSTRKSGSIGIYFHEADLPASDSSSEPPVNLSVHQAGAANAIRNLTAGTLTDVIRTKDKTVLGIDGTDQKAHLNLYNVTGNVNSGGNLDNFQMVDISKDYNTGYMHGDIKGVFLSDTDTTNASYTTVADDWATAGSWSKQSSISVSSTGSGTSGTLSITGNGTGSNVYFFNGITVEANTDYVVTITFGAYNANAFLINTTQYSTSGSKLDIHGLSGLTRGGHFNSGSSTTLYIQGWQQSSTATTITNLVVQKVSEKDRSVNNKGLAVYGTITKTPVATGADLVAYSGFSASNYLEQPYNSDFNFGTGSFSLSGWFKTNSTSGGGAYMYRGSSDADESFRIYLDSSNYGVYFDYGGGASYSYLTNAADRTAIWNQEWNQFVCHATASGQVKIYVNGVSKDITVVGAPPSSFSSTNTNVLHFGTNYSGAVPFPGSLALFRVSASIPSPEQIKKMYEDEKHLFHENAKATLYGSSDAVTALAFDDDTNLLHVGTSAGRSEFQGLRRINNTTTAVTTAISVSNGLVAEQ